MKLFEELHCKQTKKKEYEALENMYPVLCVRAKYECAKGEYVVYEVVQFLDSIRAIVIRMH